MPVCPKCKQELKYLDRFIIRTLHDKITAQAGHRVIETVSADKKEEIRCPGCGWQITDDPDEALKILQGGVTQ